MRTVNVSKMLAVFGIFGIGLWACDTSGEGGGSGGTTGDGGATSGNESGGAGGGSVGAGGAAGSGGATASGGSPGSGGASTARGGSGSGGARTGRGGAGSGGTGAGGTVAIPDAADPGAPCTVGAWPEVDPATPGPFATVMEENVGPTAGEAADGGAPPQFTLFRPADLVQGGLCHPVITWGNGTGSNPPMYKGLLNHLATHGFVVIGSNSPNVARGNPAPMVVGATWVIEQNADPSSVMYQRIDTTHVGATGHSQGGMATTQAGSDSHIITIAPICGAAAQRNLHGPALLLCGGLDTTVPCDGMIQTAFDGISNQPVMLANLLDADHGSWMTFSMGTRPPATVKPMEAAVVAWMRVHLMGDTSLRSWFYGADCKLCQDPAWKISQKMMDP
jgi:hypothetical protein